MNDEYFNNLRFADDIVLFSNSADKLQEIIEGPNLESVRVILKIYMRKTKVIFDRLASKEEFVIGGNYGNAIGTTHRLTNRRAAGGPADMSYT